MTSDVVEAAKRGDRAAFEAIFLAYAPTVLSLTHLWTRNWALAEEAVQEAFARAWSRVHELRDSARFEAWFFRVALNSSRDVIRREVHARSAPPGWSLPEPAEDIPDRRVAVTLALERLPVDLRAAVLLYYLADLSEKDTARALGWRRGTVKSRLNRARRLLAAALEDVDEEDSHGQG